MVTLYADLVELGLRVMENPKQGEIAVPAFLKVDVKNELVRRGVIDAA
ncbi:CD1375 family protein [Psychrobacillus sp. NEAU-3TGS]|nr:CD1375 family protein [Psychrobacillus sp. NEAU-3TGS]MDI2588030.1 CD1375 family protein [Psychrobacillus sp. NEAU-3TGS]